MPHYICKIVEMFEAVDGSLYFTAQWYYRAQDTVRYIFVLLVFESENYWYACYLINYLYVSFFFQVIKNLEYLIDPKRVFFSEIRDDNPLDCLVEKLNIARIPLNVHIILPLFFLFFVILSFLVVFLSGKFTNFCSYL